jgi:hypothetical protein
VALWDCTFSNIAKKISNSKYQMILMLLMLYLLTVLLQYYSTEYCISGRISSTNYSFHTDSDSDSSCDPS